jgi:hypothetical protein
MKKATSLSLVIVVALVGSRAGARESDQLDPNTPIGHPMHATVPPRGGGLQHKNAGGYPGVPGLNTIANFTGSFTRSGLDYSGNPQSTWPYAMVGRAPSSKGPTTITVPIIPVAIDLRDEQGNPRYVNGQRLYYDPSNLAPLAVNSPVFRKMKWPTSAAPTQFLDAWYRAQFWNVDGGISESWHTWLSPVVRPTRVMQLNKGTYRFLLNPDGTCCQLVEVDWDAFNNAMFPYAPNDPSGVVSGAELAGDIHTQDLSTFLFGNVVQYFGDPSNCCTAGFHTYDFEPDAQGNWTQVYTVAVASWLSPDLFAGYYPDVLALSHELAEVMADPFEYYGNGSPNQTPWWSDGVDCHTNLEVADPIEFLPTLQYPVTIDGFTYHLQNLAMLQWFSGDATAWHGAYSFPDTSVLTAPATVLGVNCAPLP